MADDRNRVCPVELSNSLDNRIRRWLQNPRHILSPFVKQGMTVLDVGCGPGFFTVDLADLVGTEGSVIAADLQEGMLQKVRAKVGGTELGKRIRFVQCRNDNVNVTEPVDFILAFYMVHEVPNKRAFFNQLAAILKENGTFLLIEPRLFHVSKNEFEQTIHIAGQSGFVSRNGPAVLFSHSAVLTRPRSG
ncbi:MAG TPA: class I SAM-dependent methyltransferase [Bacteroidota bacterium]|nr:class I SAM-dependent methyltransferase [Bacteroidota bacterium]